METVLLTLFIMIAVGAAVAVSFWLIAEGGRVVPKAWLGGLLGLAPLAILLLSGDDRAERYYGQLLLEIVAAPLLLLLCVSTIWGVARSH